MEHGDEIYSLCQVPAVVKPTIQAKPSPSQQQPITLIKKSSTEKVFRPKTLVDSTTFLLPPGNGPVYLDVKNQPKVLSAPARGVTVASSTANVFKKKQQVCSESPKATTANIFAPRTKDMNKGFLTFSDDDTGLTSKLFSIFTPRKVLNTFLFLIFCFRFCSAQRRTRRPDSLGPNRRWRVCAIRYVWPRPLGLRHVWRVGRLDPNRLFTRSVRLTTRVFPAWYVFVNQLTVADAKR